MQAFPLTALATLVAVIVLFWMGMGVAGARRKFNVPVPATTGDPQFERYFRVQMNTLEWMPIFLPSLWLCAMSWGDVIAAGIGGVWSLGRVMYALGYVREPKLRGAGFTIQALAALALWAGSLAGVARVLLAAYLT